MLMTLRCCETPMWDLCNKKTTYAHLSLRNQKKVYYLLLNLECLRWSSSFVQHSRRWSLPSIKNARRWSLPSFSSIKNRRRWSLPRFKNQFLLNFSRRRSNFVVLIEKSDEFVSLFHHVVNRLVFSFQPSRVVLLESLSKGRRVHLEKTQKLWNWFDHMMEVVCGGLFYIKKWFVVVCTGFIECNSTTFSSTLLWS